MSHPVPSPPPAGERRTFLSICSGLAMAAGLAAGYGLFTHLAGRFLYPARKPASRWLYVAQVARVPRGGSLNYATPAGARVTIARAAEGEQDGFIALSSVCPHLGCQVHWEGQNNRFFCPCHNGVFDPKGRPVSGPPKDANQSLPEFKLKVESGLLFIEVASDAAEAEGRIVDDDPRPTGPGQDPCLFQRPARDFREV